MDTLGPLLIGVWVLILIAALIPDWRDPDDPRDR